jgi:class 3 adenylate cyclase
VPELPSGLVTFCFVDVEGSTRAFKSDPEGYPGALAAHHELVRTAFEAVGGVIVETEGDGLFAAFGDSAAAVAGCLDAQLAIAAYNWPAGLSLRSRMGLHADEAVPAGDGYVALGVHQAARVSAAAHGGQVLCSASVNGQAGGAVQHAAEGLRIALEHGYAEVGWRHRTLLAWGAMVLERPELGSRLLGAIEAALDQSGGKIGAGQGGPADRDRVRSLGVAALGSGRFGEVYADGRGLAEAEAAALALSIA